MTHVEQQLPLQASAKLSKVRQAALEMLLPAVETLLLKVRLQESKLTRDLLLR